mmetsp:Transcript_78548/g.202283  ORF Transcript_78548/g.202283 Transcript_78548/m.202283 type:complete len:267 (-) Transcript_78548:555-1355(-)
MTQVGLHDLCHAVDAQHPLHDVAPERALPQCHHAAIDAKQLLSNGGRIQRVEVGQGLLHDVARVAVHGVAHEVCGPLTRLGASPDGLGDPLLLLRRAVLQQSLRHIVPEGVANKLLSIRERLVDQLCRGAAKSTAVLQEPTENPAPEAVTRHRTRTTNQLLGHEAGHRHGHRLDDLLDHVVCVGRVDGRLHMSVELCHQGLGFTAARHLQGQLHRTASQGVPRETPNGPSKRGDGRAACLPPSVQLLHDLLDLLALDISEGQIVTV